MITLQEIRRISAGREGSAAASIFLCNKSSRESCAEEGEGIRPKIPATLARISLDFFEPNESKSCRRLCITRDHTAASAVRVTEPR
jgi:hypothetical protein